MAWFKVDDGLDSHEKVEETSLAATGLWVRAGSYSARHLTDGFVPDRWFRKRAPRKHERERLIAELVAETRLVREDDGYRLHDYLDYNPSREKVEAERERERQKKSRGRSKQRQARIPWDTTRDSPGDVRGVSRGEGTGVSLSTRPDPTRPEEANASPPKPPTGAFLAEFEDWLAHHEQVTGMRPPKEGTKARAGAASAFAARRSEGYSVDELELAVAGAFADEHRWANGYFGAESVLRPQKVHDLIEKGRRAQSGFAGQAPTAADRGVTDMLEAARRFQEEDAA